MEDAKDTPDKHKRAAISPRAGDEKALRIDRRNEVLPSLVKRKIPVSASSEGFTSPPNARIRPKTDAGSNYSLHSRNSSAGASVSSQMASTRLGNTAITSRHMPTPSTVPYAAEVNPTTPVKRKRNNSQIAISPKRSKLATQPPPESVEAWLTTHLRDHPKAEMPKPKGCDTWTEEDEGARTALNSTLLEHYDVLALRKEQLRKVRLEFEANQPQKTLQEQFQERMDKQAENDMRRRKHIEEGGGGPGITYLRNDDMP